MFWKEFGSKDFELRDRFYLMNIKKEYMNFDLDLGVRMYYDKIGDWNEFVRFFLLFDNWKKLKRNLDILKYFWFDSGYIFFMWFWLVYNL